MESEGYPEFTHYGSGSSPDLQYQMRSLERLKNSISLLEMSGRQNIRSWPSWASDWAWYHFLGLKLSINSPVQANYPLLPLSRLSFPSNGTVDLKTKEPGTVGSWPWSAVEFTFSKAPGVTKLSQRSRGHFAHCHLLKPLFWLMIPCHRNHRINWRDHVGNNIQR